MITKCIIVWATILNNFSIGITPSIYEMTDMKDCEQVYRWDNSDSGLFQILPRSWGWVKENYDVPYWDYPMYGTYAQYVPKYNIEVASILVEDIHSRTNYWKPWNSSKWCWEDTDKWTAKWKSEQ
jgi:hypothetical protein